MAMTWTMIVRTSSDKETKFESMKMTLSLFLHDFFFFIMTSNYFENFAGGGEEVNF